jgi:hypothetical protein
MGISSKRTVCQKQPPRKSIFLRKADEMGRSEPSPGGLVSVGGQSNGADQASPSSGDASAILDVVSRLSSCMAR